MKKILTLLIALLLSTSLFADKTQQAKLSSDMREMLEAVLDIQRAGFYNNNKGVKDAAGRLIKGLDSLITTDAASYLPDDQKNAGKFAKKRAQMIKMYAEDLIVSLDSKDVYDGIEDYSQILRQCTSCHSRIRQKGWK